MIRPVELSAPSPLRLWFCVTFTSSKTPSRIGLPRSATLELSSVSADVNINHVDTLAPVRILQASFPKTSEGFSRRTRLPWPPPAVRGPKMASIQSFPFPGACWICHLVISLSAISPFYTLLVFKIPSHKETSAKLSNLVSLFIEGECVNGKRPTTNHNHFN